MQETFECVSKKDEPKMSEKISANGQKSRKVACSALLPKFADANIRTSKPCHLNQMVTNLERSYWIKKIPIRLFGNKTQIWPMDFGPDHESFFRTLAYL